MTLPPPAPAPPQLATAEAATYASWFACLGDPTRVRLLHAIATHAGSVKVGDLADTLGIGQPTVSHHLRKLAEVGFVTLTKQGTATRVAINQSCCTGLPHAADAVMGLLTNRPCCPSDLPEDVVVRAMRAGDMADVRRVYAEGIATGDATFDTEVPQEAVLEGKWLRDHRWVAEINGEVVGWAALTPASERPAYAGVAETSVYVAETARGRGVGKALLHRQVTEADTDGLWTLEASIFPENKPSLALHHSAGFRTVGVRERIACHHGTWRDTVLLERHHDGCVCPPGCD
ncbi:helix-turn-helix domain-containing GNAT family N-acetyltransferase [Salinactinospora qingdaonensis]|uniref:L-amino acid N-acyltransferase YncA n=1 Tax=Salinactinospora qingdaonensis TaxID=702744 RepID=A0ABP7GBQ5_9ACTN